MLVFGDLRIVELGSYDGTLGKFTMHLGNLMELDYLIEHLGNF